MNLILNSLPTKTWNWLKMNDTRLEAEGKFAPHRPQAEFDAREVSWEPAASWQRSSEAYGFSPEFTELTAAGETALAETKPGQVMEKPLVLTYCYADQERAAGRLVLHAAENSVLSAVLLLTSAGAGDVSALQVEIQADAGAKVQLYAAQLLAKDSVCMHELGGFCAEDARVSLTRLELGGVRAYTGASLDLAGDRSSFSADVGYYARTGQLLDMNYVALHHGKATESRMDASGTLEEDSRKIFRGTIDFRQGCAGARGNENENVLLLGENMVNQTIPLILCKEEDVEGNHGASIGQLDEKLLFYLGARGISPERARNMIARARIQSVCSRIPDESVREAVQKFVDGEDCGNGERLPG